MKKRKKSDVRTKASNLSWAACSCRAVLTPDHLLIVPPANKSCAPHDQTLLLCRWSQVLDQCGTGCGPHCCRSAESKWSAKYRTFWNVSHGVRNSQITKVWVLLPDKIRSIQSQDRLLTLGHLWHKCCAQVGLWCDITWWWHNNLVNHEFMSVLHNMKNGQMTPNLSIKTQIFVVGRDLENWCPQLCSFCYWGLIDGGGEKRHVVIDILGEKRERDLGANW